MGDLFLVSLARYATINFNIGSRYCPQRHAPLWDGNRKVIHKEGYLSLAMYTQGLLSLVMYTQDLVYAGPVIPGYFYVGPGTPGF